LLNHLTGTLDDIEALKEDTESLLNTIKLPRRLGQITEVMPASQYLPSPRAAEGKEIKRMARERQSSDDGFQNELKEKARI